VARARLALLVALATLTVAVLPAAAGGNDWGTWTFAGHNTKWSGTFFSAHRITGVVMGLKSIKKYNSVTSFKMGGKTCKISDSHGDAYCYSLHWPPNKKVNWTLTTRKNVASSDGLVPCIQYQGKFHCRYGNG
jgi:hypothetical protein